MVQAASGGTIVNAKVADGCNNDAENEPDSDNHLASGVSSKDPTCMKWSIPCILWRVLWVVAAIAEGFAMTKCLVPYPKVLADQFVFRNCIVLKVFMSGVGFSMLSGAFMTSFASEQFEKSRFYGTKSFGYIRVIFGTSILGAGMAIGGSGPTMFGPAIGGHVKTAWALIVGGLAAAVLIGLLDKAMTSKTVTAKPRDYSLTLEVAVAQVTGKTLGYSWIAAAMGLFMVVATLVLEALFSFKEDAMQYGGVLSQPYPENIFDYPAWPPILAGLSIGLAQIPSRMVTSDGLGGATAVVVVISTLTGGWLSPGKSLCDSLANAWQVVYNYVFALGGAALAVVATSSWALDETEQPLTEGFSPIRMAVGGFLAIAGGRIAGGCTCGHGISGTSELSIESFIGAGAIFGSAILTRCILVFAFEVNY